MKKKNDRPNEIGSDFSPPENRGKIAYSPPIVIDFRFLKAKPNY